MSPSRAETFASVSVASRFLAWSCSKRWNSDAATAFSACGDALVEAVQLLLEEGEPLLFRGDGRVDVGRPQVRQGVAQVGVGLLQVGGLEARERRVGGEARRRLADAGLALAGRGACRLLRRVIVLPGRVPGVVDHGLLVADERLQVGLPALERLQLLLPRRRRSATRRARAVLP